MRMLVYDTINWRRMYSKTKEDELEYFGPQKILTKEEELYSSEGQLYEDMLEKLCRDFLKDKYSLCLQIRQQDKLIYEFPQIPCPGLFLEQLRIRKI